jgi:hypothetical protein
MEVEVSKFNKSSLIVQKGRSIIRIKLQDTSKHNFFNLLISDVLYIYVEGDDYSKAYIMPNVKDFNPNDLDLSLEHQDYVRRMEDKNTKELAAIDDNISYIINNSSDVRTDKFQTISEALFLAITEPRFLQELRTRLNNVEV